MAVLSGKKSKDCWADESLIAYGCTSIARMGSGAGCRGRTIPARPGGDAAKRVLGISVSAAFFGASLPRREAWSGLVTDPTNLQMARQAAADNRRFRRSE